MLNSEIPRRRKHREPFGNHPKKAILPKSYCFDHFESKWGNWGLCNTQFLLNSKRRKYWEPFGNHPKSPYLLRIIVLTILTKKGN